MSFLRHLRISAASLLLCALIASPPPVRAQDASGELNLPGLQNDAANFQSSLSQPFPAGVPAARLKQAEDAAAQALAAKDYTKALPALQVIAAAAERQNATPDWHLWLAIAEAKLTSKPPRPQQALQAGWLAFTTIDQKSPTAAADQVASLTLMRAAAASLQQPVPEVQILAAIARRLPKDDPAQAELRQRRQALGLVFNSLATDAESFPARACLSFLGDPSTSPDFHPGDWIT
ncbi:MAG TPA: hypothetical protein VHX12_03305, partial [Acidisoma sp.]|nr:hypothetical protein [Acidisoma sp.]